MISVVVPLYNESLLAGRFLEAVFAQLMALERPFEVLCVDDGSTDDTLSRLLEFKEGHRELKVISLARNFGLQAALMAGLQHAKGDWVITMDGDFQDPPEVIPRLLEKQQEYNCEVVLAVRQNRKEGWMKRFYIALFHRIFRRMSEGAQVEQAGNFCLMSRKAVDAVLRFKEYHRYFPGIRNFIGFKTGYLVFDRPERPEGKAKMDTRKLLTMAADAIYSFSKWPVRACLYLGILGVVFFFFAIVYALVSKFTGLAPVGWSSTFLAISFFGSVQLTFLGVIGEYVYRIYKEVQKRPVYLVNEIYE